jgi:hypothetical protein
MSAKPQPIRLFPWERPEFERAHDVAAREQDHEDDSFVTRLKALTDLEEPSSIVASVPRLLREASEAIRAAEARASAIASEMQQAIEAAEVRAREAEDRFADLEEQARRAIQAAEHKAEVAEARVKAAEAWLARVREALSYPG